MTSTVLSPPTSPPLPTVGDGQPTSLARATLDSSAQLDLLADTALHADSPRIEFGPLWGARVSRGTKCRPELLAYDIFCLVFLDRPGSYYKRDQRTRALRGDLTAERVIACLRAYYTVLLRERGDGAMTRAELRAWWLMGNDTRCWMQQHTPAYDLTYVPFVRKFLPQQRDHSSEWYLFDSLLRYVPLLLSSDVCLRRVAGISGNLCWGVFAQRALPERAIIGAIHGQIIRLTECEEDALREHGADHSLMHIPLEHEHRLRIPDGVYAPVAERDRRAARRAKGKPQRRVRARQSSSLWVVAGGVAFFNHACCAHAACEPCDRRDDDDIGAGQWQLAKTVRAVRAGEELCVDYTGGDAQAEQRWPCMRCSQHS